MRPFERRAARAYPYFRLALWDAGRCVWTQLGGVYESEAEARSHATAGDRYRVSVVEENGRRWEMEPFDVA